MVKTQHSLDKAGFILCGKDEKGELCVLVSWSQGRFNPDPRDIKKYYAMTKGSIDHGESPLKAGEREAFEEGGISIKRLLGKRGWHDYLNGIAMPKSMPSGYENVNIVSANPKDYIDYAYQSISGKTQHVRLFKVEVDRIDLLRPYLKRPLMPNEPANISDITARPPTQDTSFASKHELDSGIDDYLEAQGYPTFKQRLEILRTGKIKAIPGSIWADQDRTIIEHPCLAEIEERYHVNFDSFPNSLKLADFCHKTLEKNRDSNDDHKHFSNDLKRLKTYFTEKGMIGDNLAVKFDTHDCLNFYFEGGDILPLSQVVKRSIMAAAENPIYARAQWGIHNNENVSESINAQVKLAQINGLAKVFGLVNNNSAGVGTSIQLDKISMLNLPRYPNKQPQFGLLLAKAFLNQANDKSGTPGG